MANPCEREESPGMMCPRTANDQVRIRDSGTGKIHKVWLCSKHKAEHNRSAAEKRATSK